MVLIGIVAVPSCRKVCICAGGSRVPNSSRESARESAETFVANTGLCCFTSVASHVLLVGDACMKAVDEVIMMSRSLLCLFLFLFYFFFQYSSKRFHLPTGQG